MLNMHQNSKATNLINQDIIFRNAGLRSRLYQGNTLSLTNVVTYPHFFLTAYKRLLSMTVLAGMSD